MFRDTEINHTRSLLLRDFQSRGKTTNNHLNSIITINTIMVSKTVSVSYHSDATFRVKGQNVSAGCYHMLEKRSNGKSFSPGCQVLSPSGHKVASSGVWLHCHPLVQDNSGLKVSLKDIFKYMCSLFPCTSANKAFCSSSYQAVPCNHVGLSQQNLSGTAAK